MHKPMQNFLRFLSDEQYDDLYRKKVDTIVISQVGAVRVYAERGLDCIRVVRDYGNGWNVIETCGIAKGKK